MLVSDGSPAGWWTELSYNRHVARGLADRQAREQNKRRAEIRRKVERSRELLCLAETSVGEASRHLRRCDGLSYERRSAGPEVEQFVGRPVGSEWLWARGFEQGKDYVVNGGRVTWVRR